MAGIVNTHYMYCGQKAALNFTYTGTYNQRDDGVVELLTSGTLVFLNPAVIDIFCVGGGGAGALQGPSSGLVQYGAGGGGAGYTATVKAQQVAGSYEITVGRGAEPGGSAGGATTFGALCTAAGGKCGLYLVSSGWRTGAAGGSGGGGSRDSTTNGGAGGSDGSDGVTGGTGSSANPGGKGQGTTTREFGEPSGKLYSGGGGGGTYISSASPVQTSGGAGGGGAGGWAGTSSQSYQPAGAGGANTGGGGGGGARGNMISIISVPGSGGSGIACFRVAK